MHEIDLGKDVEIKVKWREQVYSVREPCIAELERFQKEAEADPAKVYEFLGLLGMPQEVLKGMPVSKAKKLIDELLGIITEKK